MVNSNDVFLASPFCSTSSRLLRLLAFRIEAFSLAFTFSQDSGGEEFHKYNDHLFYYKTLQLCDHEQEVTHADISPDGRLLATCGRDAKICIYKIGEFK